MAEEKKVVLTKEGYQKLVEELEYLKTTRRKEISEQIAIARGFGDLSENAEYDEARKDQSRNESKILEMEATLNNCVVVEESELNADVAGVGSSITLKNNASGSTMTVTLVGANEIDPGHFKISTDSPIGAAVLNHKKGDVVDVVLPAGTVKMEITGLSR